jgi:hypothetical protein
MFPNPKPPSDPAKPPFILWRPFLVVWRWLAPHTQGSRDRQSKTSRIVGASIVIVATLSLCTAVILYARPIYNAWQDWRATRLVSHARSLVDEGELLAAIMAAQEAYTLSPENPDAIRLNAEFFTRMKKTEALYFWDKLRTLDTLTPEDEQQRIRALLNADRDKEARQTLDDWMSRYAPQDDTIRLAQEVYGDGSFLGSLLFKLKSYTASHPDDRDSLLRLARLQIESEIPAETGEALALLWHLADGDDSVGIQALETLSNFPNIPPEDFPRLIDLLLNHPRSTNKQKVKAYHFRLQFRPEQRLAIIAQATHEFRGRKREDLLPLVRWLVEINEYQQVLSLVDEEDILTYQPLLENYLTSLTALNRFEDLRRLVNDPRVNSLLTRSTAAFYQLHLAFVTRQPLTELRARMETATLHAQNEGRVEMLLSIGKYGELRGMPDLAEPAYAFAMRSRRAFIPALEGLLRSTHLSGNTTGHLAALQDAARQWPDNQDYQENLVYVRLLIGQQIETSSLQVSALVKQRPNDPVTQLLAAMSGWRLRDLDLALKHLAPIDPSQLSPGQRSVFAAITRDAGKPEQARQALVAVPADAIMFPQERDLFAAVK